MSNFSYHKKVPHFLFAAAAVSAPFVGISQTFADEAPVDPPSVTFIDGAAPTSGNDGVLPPEPEAPDTEEPPADSAPEEAAPEPETDSFEADDEDFVSPSDLDTAFPVHTSEGINNGKIENGFYFEPSEPLFSGDRNFATPDESTVAPVAEVDSSKTLEDLKRVEAIRLINPGQNFAHDTFAYTLNIQDAPLDPHSAEKSKNFARLSAISHNTPVSIGLNGGGFTLQGGNTGSGVDNIPFYVVDSSNPHQHFGNFTSTDPRTTSFPKLVELTTGRLPIPEWAKPAEHGDKPLAVYDVATGIWRSYFYVTIDPETNTYKFKTSGYLYADKNAEGMNKRNFHMNLVQGSSSVVGFVNELTQIGIEEIRHDKIEHTVSFTAADYATSDRAFLAKQTDGTVGWNPKYTEFDNSMMVQVGQFGRLPKSIDINKLNEELKGDSTSLAWLWAVQNKGIIPTDHNLYVNAFNLESPLGHPLASEGKNVYVEEGLKKKVDSLYRFLQRFDFSLIEWVHPDWVPVAAASADSAPVDETPSDSAPVNETPSDETPSDETPSDETPSDETPTDGSDEGTNPVDEGSNDDSQPSSPVDEVSDRGSEGDSDSSGPVDETSSDSSNEGTGGKEVDEGTSQPADEGKNASSDGSTQRTNPPRSSEPPMKTPRVHTANPTALPATGSSNPLVPLASIMVALGSAVGLKRFKR